MWESEVVQHIQTLLLEILLFSVGYFDSNFNQEVSDSFGLMWWKQGEDSWRWTCRDRADGFKLYSSSDPVFKYYTDVKVPYKSQSFIFFNISHSKNRERKGTCAAEKSPLVTDILNFFRLFILMQQNVSTFFFSCMLKIELVLIALYTVILDEGFST